MWTKRSRPLTNFHFTENHPTNFTRQSVPPIRHKRILITTTYSACIDKFSDRRPAITNSFSQLFFNFAVNIFQTFVGQILNFGDRMNAGRETNFVGVNIADPDNIFLIE